MSKPTYLQGLQDCEKMFHIEGYTLEQLRAYIDNENDLLDYRGADWVEGFVGGIDHFVRLEKLKR